MKVKQEIIIKGEHDLEKYKIRYFSIISMYLIEIKKEDMWAVMKEKKTLGEAISYIIAYKKDTRELNDCYFLGNIKDEIHEYIRRY